MKCTAVVVKRGATFSIILEYLANHIENWCHFDTISSNVSALGKKMPVIWSHSPEKFSQAPKWKKLGCPPLKKFARVTSIFRARTVKFCMGNTRLHISWLF